MTPEEQVDADKNAAQEEADALAQFASGYTGTDLATEAPDKAVASVEPDVQTAEGDEPLKTEGTEAAGESDPPKPDVTPATISKEQVDQLLAAANSIGDIRSAVEKLRGDAFGRMGGLERTLKLLQEATPAGQPIELASEDLAELKKEYPDLTENLVTGLSRVFKKIKGTGGAPASYPEDFDQRVIEKASAIANEVIARESGKIREEVATQMLDAQHEGWRQLVGPKDSDTDYRRWLKAQGSAYEKHVLSSNSPVEIGRSISKFKETAKKKPAPPASPDHDRKQRLAEAITPRGGKPPMPKAKTPEEEFAEGYAYQTAG